MGRFDYSGFGVYNTSWWQEEYGDAEEYDDDSEYNAYFRDEVFAAPEREVEPHTDRFAHAREGTDAQQHIERARACQRGFTRDQIEHIKDAA